MALLRSFARFGMTRRWGSTSTWAQTELSILVSQGMKPIRDLKHLAGLAIR